MDYVQQEINLHKGKLMSLVNNLINTQLIIEEISINNEIKKESECLISLLNIKQKNLLNKMNYNINFNPLMLQPNQMMDNQFMNINAVQMGKQQIFQNNDVGGNKINIYFRNVISGKLYTIQSNNKEEFSEVIKRYRQRASDYKDNYFLLNGKALDPSSKLSLDNIGVSNFSYITVSPKHNVIGSIEFITKKINF